MVLLQKDLATKTAVTVAFVGSILAALALAQAPNYPPVKGA